MPHPISPSPARASRRLLPLSSAAAALTVTLTAALAATASLPVHAAPETASSGWAPDGFFVQGARGSSRTTAGTVGLTWRPSDITRLGPGTLTYYFEAAVGRWDPEGHGPNERSVTQIGVTPVLRWQADGNWFGEAGIGANAITPVFRAGDRRFSTVFQFGDHLGAGYRFGAANENELALRIEHFSNASIKRPNPGIEFLQLRYARKF